jgi:hypothetical protein
MEHRYYPRSIFESKVFEDYVKLSLETYFTPELFRLAEIQQEQRPVSQISIAAESRASQPSYSAIALQLMGVLKAFLKGRFSSETLSTLASVLLDHLFAEPAGQFIPRNNSTVGTR